MRKLKLAICEDEEKEYQNFLTLLEKSGVENEVDYFCDGSDLLKQFYQGKYDLIFMDIYMNQMNAWRRSRKFVKLMSMFPLLLRRQVRTILRTAFAYV